MNEEGLRLISLDPKNGNFLGEHTSYALGYQHSFTEGPYEARWEIEEGKGEVTREGLLFWFNHRYLAAVAAEYRGVKVWGGRISEMTLNIDGLAFTRSLDQLANAIKVQFHFRSEKDGRLPGYTPWYLNELSQKRWGTWEHIYQYDGNIGEYIDPETGEKFRTPKDDPDWPNRPITEPEVFGQHYARDHGSTIERTITTGDPDRNFLSIKVHGPMRMAERVYVSDGMLPFDMYKAELPWNFEDVREQKLLRHVPATCPYAETKWGNILTASQEIERLLYVYEQHAIDNGYQRFLYPLSIDMDHDLPTTAGVEHDRIVPAIKRITDLAALPTLSGKYYELYVDWDGGVIFRPETTDPAYEIYKPPEGYRIKNSDRRPTWDARPLPAQLMDPEYFDFLIDEFREGKVIFKSEKTTMREGAEVAEFSPKGELNEAQKRAQLRAYREKYKRSL
jgi:hypothetical protein